MHNHTRKMYFSGRSRASTFPRTCEAEKRPVIQLNTAALLLSLTTSAWHRKFKHVNIIKLFTIFCLDSDSLRNKISPHMQQKCRKYSLDWLCTKLGEPHSRHIQIPQTDSRQVKLQQPTRIQWKRETAKTIHKQTVMELEKGHPKFLSICNFTKIN